MKQRLLLSLLMLFVSVGLMQGAKIKVTSTGKDAVTVTVKGGIITSVGNDDNVTLNSNKTVVTIAKAYTSEVSIETQAAVTEVSFSGEMTALDINGGSALTTINFGSSKVKALTVSGKAIESLNCSNLGLTSLTISEASKLKTVNASHNELNSITGLSSIPLSDLNISYNKYEGSLSVANLSDLTNLDVSYNKLTNVILSSGDKLKKVTLGGNKILTADIPDGCTADWGMQTTSVTLTENFIKANIGVNVADLIKKAGIKNAEGTDEIKADKIKVTSWQVMNGTKYEADNNKTVHQQSGYPTNYLFYDTDQENLYVDGTYQCTLNYDGRDYAIQGITVSPAKVDLTVEVPANVSKVTVSAKESHPFTQTGVLEGLEQGSTIHVSVEPKAGYEDVTYDVVGLSSGNQKPPYSGKNIDLVVAAKFGSDPKLSVSVDAGGHKVVYDNKNVIGGDFTVQKISEGKTVGLPANGTISTGEELVVKIFPKTNNFRLLINEEDKTAECTSNPDGNYVYSQKITAEDYPDNEDISVVVTFTSSVTVSAKIDGESFVKSEKLPKGTLAISGATTGTEEIILGEGEEESAQLIPNASYKARFTLGEDYRLKDNKITVNGGAFDSYTKIDNEDGSITYNVIFTVKESNVTLSISTVKLSPATINITSLLQEDINTDNSKESVQRQTYDGNAKPVLYTTTPANLKVEANYKSQDKTTDYENKAPTDAGTYFVTLSLADNDVYTADVKYVYLIIEPATPEIKSLPTVTVSEDGQSYEYTGGEVLFNGEAIDGKWEFGQVSSQESHTTTATFKPNNKNLAEATASVDVIIDGKTVPSYSIKMKTLPSGYTITWYNGSKVIDIDKEKVTKGTPLTAVVTYPKGTKGITLKATTEVNIEQPKLSTAESEDGRNVYTFKLGDESVYNEVTFEVVAGIGNQYTIVLDVDNHNNLYTGEPQAYDWSKIRVYDINKQPVDLSTLEMAVTYKSGNTEISEPIDAGTYSVTVTIAADAEKGYIESSATKADAFTIDKIEASVSKWPTASVIAKGMPLSVSDLVDGAANIEGTFEWVDKETVLEKSGTYEKYYVKFIPSKAYATNYTEVISDDPVKVTVSDLQIVAFSQPAEGTIEVSKNGTAIATSDPIINGDKLTITVMPKTDWEVTSITVNGKSCSFTQSNGKYVATYLVGDVSAAIEATFKAKSTEVIDPNSQYKVTVTESVRGAIISHPGENVVKRGESFTFTVSTLAADASKVKVTPSNGTVKKGSNGSYTLSDVKANTTITVSLSNPTPLKVEVQKDYLNANKYHIGQVEIIDGEATTYYYGDVITVMADPEDGVKFVKWSDGSTDKIHEITLKADTKVVASFSGVPTGIEDIESAAITTGKGFIMVKNVANAKVTVVSISGRLQAQEEVSGDTRIDVPQGIYVVVLESGSDVKRTKVIVK